MVDELLCARSARSSRLPQFQRLVEHRCLISFGKKVMTRSVGNQILTSYVFFSFPQKRNGIVFSSGVNYLHSGGNIQSE